MSTVVTGKANINGVRMATLLIGLKAEMRGMRLTRSVNCYQTIKREYGLKGSKQKVYEQFKKIKEEYDKEHGFSS